MPSGDPDTPCVPVARPSRHPEIHAARRPRAFVSHPSAHGQNRRRRRVVLRPEPPPAFTRLAEFFVAARVRDHRRFTQRRPQEQRHDRCDAAGQTRRPKRAYVFRAILEALAAQHERTAGHAGRVERIPEFPLAPPVGDNRRRRVEPLPDHAQEGVERHDAPAERDEFPTHRHVRIQIADTIPQSPVDQRRLARKRGDRLQPATLGPEGGTRRHGRCRARVDAPDARSRPRRVVTLDPLPRAGRQQRRPFGVRGAQVEAERLKRREQRRVLRRPCGFRPNRRFKIRHQRQGRIRSPPGPLPERRIVAPGRVTLAVDARPAPEQHGEPMPVVGWASPERDEPALRDLPERRVERGPHPLRDVHRPLRRFVRQHQQRSQAMRPPRVRADAPDARPGVPILDDRPVRRILNPPPGRLGLDPRLQER